MWGPLVHSSTSSQLGHVYPLNCGHYLSVVWMCVSPFQLLACSHVIPIWSTLTSLTLPSPFFWGGRFLQVYHQNLQTWVGYYGGTNYTEKVVPEGRHSLATSCSVSFVQRLYLLLCFFSLFKANMLMLLGQSIVQSGQASVIYESAIGEMHEQLMLVGCRPYLFVAACI